MAADRSSAIEIVSDSSPENDDPTSPSSPTSPTSPTSPDVPAKKKKFAPLKSLKKLFASSKKKKTKEDVTGVTMKSTSLDVLEARQNDGTQLSGKNQMSMSADSVFSSDRPRDPGMEFTRSMEAIPGANFKDELARKLHGRRSDDDEGFPSSPPAHTTTVDALIENGLKEKSMSMDSEHSLMSMDSSEAELEEDFFRTDWASGSTSHLAESPSTNATDYDLDVVVSTTSLNIQAAKHKIAIKPKSKARTSAHIQRRKTASPKPPGGVMVLPKVKEENQPVTATMDFGEDADTSQERIDSTDDEIEVDIHDAEPRSEASDQDLDPKSDTEDQEVELSFSDKTAISSDDDLKDSPRDFPSPVDKPEDKPTVVLRRKGSPDKQERDTSNRRTIAGDTITTESTVFGERKLKRSSQIIDRNWDQLGKPKDNTEDDSEVKGSSEFANVFAKFKEKASTNKTDTDKKAENLDNKQGAAIYGAEKLKQPVTKKVSNSGSVTVGFTPQTKQTKTTTRDKPSTVTKPVEDSKSKVVPDKSKVVQDKSKVVQDKSKVVQDKSKVIPDKTKVVTDKPKVVPDKTIVVPDKTKVATEAKIPAKVVIIEKKEGTTVNKSFSKKSNDIEKDSVSNVVRREKVDKVKEKPQRDSDPKRSSGEIISKRTSGEKIVTKRISGELGKKGSEDVPKRSSGEVVKSSKDPEPKRNSGEILSKADTVTKKSSAFSVPKPVESENKNVGASKVSSKFISVHSKSVSLNDAKKSESVAKATSHQTGSSSASSEKKQQTKTVPKSASGNSASGANNLTVESSTESFKRDSPRVANRLRSQTLPDSAVIKNSISPGGSPSIKRANSHDDGVNKENIPSADETSPKKSGGILRSAASGRPAPQRLTTGGKPNWIEMARKRTEGWNEEKDKELESKAANEGENADKRASSVLDLMKRFQ